MKTSFRAVLALAAILALSGCQKTADAAFGQKVRAYLLEHPEVIEEAVQKLQEKKIADAANIAKAGMVKHREALERDPRDFVANPNGKITVVEFFDYRCGYCKTSAPEILQIIRDNPDVRFVFKEFPIFGEVSDTAARLAMTPQGKAKGLALYKALMADRGLDEAALDRHLREAGLDPATVRKAARNPAIDAQIADVRTLARNLGLEGTPAFVIGDYMIPGADMAAVRAALARVKAEAMKRPGSPT
jgi:protein-disulfide isomerase